MIAWLKQYWVFLVILCLIVCWATYSRLNANADYRTAECGFWMVYSYETTEHPLIEQMSSVKQYLDDLMIRVETDTHNLANEFRDQFGWGRYPPENIQLLVDKFYIENKLDELKEQTETP